MNYLLRMFAKNESIAGSKDKIPTIIQPTSKTLMQDADELMAWTLRCGDVYEEKNLKEIFIKRLDKPIWQSMNGCRSTQ